MPDEQTLLDALDLITLPDPLLPQGLSGKQLKEFKLIQRFVSGPNTVGTGVAEKVTAGRMLDEVSLKFYVRKKLSKKQLNKAEFIPERITPPGFADSLLTDVEEIGDLKLEAYTTRVRPALPGYSIGEPASMSGTFGCLVQSIADPNAIFILSNAHVLARSGLIQQGAGVTQPDRADGGRVPQDLIGTLVDATTFNFEPGFNNLCDAALVRPSSMAEVTSFIAKIGVPMGVNTNLQRQMHVQKTGRTTEHTVGIIRDVNFRTNALVYPKPQGGQGKVGFFDQVLCEVFTKEGDSGSLVCDMEGRAVGLHWAGSLSSSVFNKIQHVLTRFEVEVVTRRI